LGSWVQWVHLGNEALSVVAVFWQPALSKAFVLCVDKSGSTRDADAHPCTQLDLQAAHLLAEAEQLSTCVVASPMFTPLAVPSCSSFAARLERRSNSCF